MFSFTFFFYVDRDGVTFSSEDERTLWKSYCWLHIDSHYCPSNVNGRFLAIDINVCETAVSFVKYKEFLKDTLWSTLCFTELCNSEIPGWRKIVPRS